MSTTRKRYANDEIRPPRGVSGKQRELFLSLSQEERRTYRYHFDIAGRPAAMCYRYATGSLR